MGEYAPIPIQDEALAKKIIGGATEVHRELGLGYWESIYRKAMAYELSSQGIHFERHWITPWSADQL